MHEKFKPYKEAYKGFNKREKITPPPHTQIIDNMANMDYKTLGYLVSYYPSRIKNVGEEGQKARKLIYDFKDGRNDADIAVADMTASLLIEKLGEEELSDMMLVCVPASTTEKNEIRYKRFYERVSELTGIANGYDCIRVEGDRLAVHERHHKKSITRTQVIMFDAMMLLGKKVVVFDDVITSGKSFSLFAEMLEAYGAEVVGGMFLGKTQYYVR